MTSRELPTWLCRVYYKNQVRQEREPWEKVRGPSADYAAEKFAEELDDSDAEGPRDHEIQVAADGYGDDPEADYEEPIVFSVTADITVEYNACEK